MPNREQLLEILERLENDPELDITQEELRNMLEEELAKPDDQMDVDLLQELLLVLEEEEPEVSQRRAWRCAEQDYARRPKHPVLRWVFNITVAAFALVGLYFVTYKTAEAFNNEALIRLLNPSGQTFMIFSAPLASDAAPQKTASYRGVVSADCIGAEGPRQYASPDEIPQTLSGFPARPGGIPERFAFQQGYVYTDELSTTLTHVYGSGSQTCVFTLMVPDEDATVAIQQSRRTIAETQECIVAGCSVTYGMDDEGEILSASWTKDQAQYTIFGTIDEVELTQIVDATMNQ